MKNKKFRRQVTTYKPRRNYFGWIILLIGIVLVLNDLNYINLNLNLRTNPIIPIALIIIGLLIIRRKQQ